MSVRDVGESREAEVIRGRGGREETESPERALWEWSSQDSRTHGNNYGADEVVGDRVGFLWVASDNASAA